MSLSSDSIKLTGDAAYPYMEPPLPIITFSNYDATVITINDSLDGGLICNSDIQLSGNLTDNSASNNACIYFNNTMTNISGVLNCSTNGLITSSMCGANLTNIPSVQFNNDSVNVSGTYVNISGVLNCSTNGLITSSMCGANLTNIPSIEFNNDSVNVSGTYMNVSSAMKLSYSSIDSNGLPVSDVPVLEGDFTWAVSGAVYCYNTTVDNKTLHTLAIV